MDKRVADWLKTVDRYNRWFWRLGGFVMAFLLLHFVAEIYVFRDDTLRSFRSPRVTVFPEVLDVGVIERRLNAAIPKRSIENTQEVVERDMQLQGVFSVGRQRFAVFALAPSGVHPLERRTMRVGGEIEGWLVESIGRSDVSLRKGADFKALALFPRKK